MHIDETTSMSTRLSRALKAGMAVTLAAVITAWAPISEGANGTAQKSDGTPVCTYSGFSFDAASNVLNITCDTVVAGQPGTFTLSAGPLSVSSPGSATITVSRGGGATGGYTVPYSFTATGLTGWSLTSPNSVTPITANGSDFVTFSDSDSASKSVTFSSGTTAGTFVLTVGTPVAVAPNVVATTASGNPTISVTLGSQPPPGCTTTATYNGTFGASPRLARRSCSS